MSDTSVHVVRAAAPDLSMLPGWGWAVLGATLLAFTVLAVLALVVLDHWSVTDAERHGDDGLGLVTLADTARERIESLLAPGVAAPLRVDDQAYGEPAGRQP